MTRMPAVFVGHGNPMNALAHNAYTEAWRRLGETLPRPKAVLAISAHWYEPGLRVGNDVLPRTIHDFGRFPRELFEVQYPAAGDPTLAHRVRDLLAPLDVALDTSWGLDHGTWSVLCHVYPKADIPVVQLGIDSAREARFHYDLGRRLAALRDEGVLIFGSGNIVHNLRAYAWGRDAQPYDWALRFDAAARDLIQNGEVEPLIRYERLGPDAALAIPTPEHYLPLLYVLGAGHPGETVAFPVEGIEGASMSMRAVQVG